MKQWLWNRMIIIDFCFDKFRSAHFWFVILPIPAICMQWASRQNRVQPVCGSITRMGASGWMPTTRALQGIFPDSALFRNWLISTSQSGIYVKRKDRCGLTTKDKCIPKSSSTNLCSKPARHWNTWAGYRGTDTADLTHSGQMTCPSASNPFSKNILFETEPITKLQTKQKQA